MSETLIASEEARQQKNRGGRPKIDPSQKRSVPVGCWLTERKAERLDSMCGSMPRGEYIRNVLFKRSVTNIPAVNKTAWGHLGKTLGGITTIMRCARSGAPVPVEVVEEIRALREQVELLRGELLGEYQTELEGE